MRMVCIAFPHLALVLGIGGCMGMMALYLLGSRIATGSDLYVKKHCRATCHAGPSSFKGQPGRPLFQRTFNKSSSDARRAYHCQL
jgi:hypothetical protein